MIRIQTVSLRRIFYLLILLGSFPLLLDSIVMYPRLKKLVEHQVMQSSEHIAVYLAQKLPMDNITAVTPELELAVNKVMPHWKAAYDVVRIDLYDLSDKRIFSTNPGDTGKIEPGVMKQADNEIIVEIFDTQDHKNETLNNDKRYAEVKKIIGNNKQNRIILELYFDVTEEFAALAFIKRFYLVTLVLVETIFLIISVLLILNADRAFMDRKKLAALLPICSACKKIRDDEGYWQHVEEYFKSQTSTRFTHGICPDCEREIYPDVSVTRSELHG